MTITSGLRAWLNTWEGLAGDRINVDCLPNNQNGYSLDSDPTITETRFLYGPRAVERVFILSSLEAWGEDILQNEEVLEWYESLSAWVRGKNRRREFPDIGDTRRVRGISVVSAPYPFSVPENGNARYQVQIKLNYYEE